MTPRREDMTEDERGRMSDAYLRESTALMKRDVETRNVVAERQRVVERVLLAWVAFRNADPDHWWDRGCKADKAWETLDDELQSLDEAFAARDGGIGDGSDDE